MRFSIVRTGRFGLGGSCRTKVNCGAIADAFRLFVKTHQKLLDVMIGVDGFITKIPFVGPPMAAALRSVEKAVDTLAFGIIDTLEASVAAALRTDYDGLKVTIGSAASIFS
ncbi:hypothetical protein B0I37DRAFT_356713 [Chaetomium sp. MPI-CAGE-AT-0009]|nr:hypothetical protein B0I37DRAFT_356713 [Chaetomium sp. MPI-CAGE-AT-0009]